MIHSLKRARDGDPSSKKKITDILRARLAKMAHHYARCTGEDADDLLQEAWVGLLEALSELNLEIGSPEHYLIRSARWRLLDSIKRAKVRRCLSLDEFDYGLDCDPGGANTVLSSACAADFVAGLTDTQRAVLECLLCGLTWREAGDVLGCTSANIAYYVRQMRRKWEEWSEDPVAPAL
jgi:RNA polymerase sigma-70 factor (ECF subfamily)